MAWTETELAEIEAAYKSGVKRVQFKDRSTEFRELDEMRQIIAEARADLSGKKREPYLPRFHRGYQS